MLLAEEMMSPLKSNSTIEISPQDGKSTGE